MSEEQSSSSSGSQKKWTADDDHAASMAKWWPRMYRTSDSCSWNQFCQLLHELLSSKKDGFDSSNEICRLLFEKTKISAQLVALQSGFLNWEQMLHSEMLEHVVIVEELENTPDWKTYRYRAALWRPNYNQPPRTFPPKLNPHWRDRLQVRSEPLVKMLEERKRAETASISGERKKEPRMKIGALISYEVSDDEEEEEKEMGKGPSDFSGEDEEGDGWPMQQEGDGKGLSSDMLLLPANDGALILPADDKHKSRNAKVKPDEKDDLGKGRMEKTVMDEGSGSGSDWK